VEVLQVWSSGAESHDHVEREFEIVTRGVVVVDMQGGEAGEENRGRVGADMVGEKNKSPFRVEGEVEMHKIRGMEENKLDGGEVVEAVNGKFLARV